MGCFDLPRLPLITSIQKTLTWQRLKRLCLFVTYNFHPSLEVVSLELGASGCRLRPVTAAFYNQIADDAEVCDTARPGVGGGGYARGGSGGKCCEGGADQVRNIDLTGLEPPILAQILQTQFYFPIHPTKRP